MKQLLIASTISLLSGTAAQDTCLIIVTFLEQVSLRGVCSFNVYSRYIKLSEFTNILFDNVLLSLRRTWNF